MVFTFSIDKYANKYVPPSQVSRLPGPLRRLLGGFPAAATHDYFIWLEILLASFCGISLLAGVFQNHTVFTSHNANNIIALYAATAILCFNASQVPLAQPRNILMGHFLSSLIGICIQKLFFLSEGGRSHTWASAGLSVAVSSVAMSICNCVHPPAGALAMLPLIDQHVRNMSWWYLPVQLVLLVLIIPVACIFGNVFRRYPVYWWTPADCGSFWKKPEKEAEETKEGTESETVKDTLGLPPYRPDEGQRPLAPVRSNSSHASVWSHRLARTESRMTIDEGKTSIVRVPGLRKIEIGEKEIFVPAELDLDDILLDWLRSMRMELRRMEHGSETV